MTQWTRILLPVGLGVAAFGLNAWTMARAVTPPYYVRAKTEIKAGEEIKPDMLAPIPLPGSAQHLDKVLVPWSQRSMLTSLRVRRAMTSGDLVFLQDIDSGQAANPNEERVTVPVNRAAFEPNLIDPGDHVSFLFRSNDKEEGKLLGEFRVIAIGSRNWIHANSRKHNRAQSVTVAVVRDSPQHIELQRMLPNSSVHSVTYRKQ